ncbi:MAG: AI-2E family transporter, partial [Isosphaeraceae bacterium]
CLAPGGKWLQELSYQRAWQFGGPIFDDRRRPSCRAIPKAEVRNSMEPTKEQPGVVANGRAARLRRDLVPLYALAAAVLCAAGSWYLLKELAPLLRPLILAVFLAYTILPAHRALRRRVPAKVAGPLLVLLVATVVLGLAVLIYGNLIDLKAELPRLIERAQGLIERLRTWGRGHLPVWVLNPVPDAAQAEAETAARLKALMSGLVNTAASFLAEALIVVFYLVFLLLEARRFPERVRAVFPPEQADRVLGILGSINRAMASYLRAKVLSSLVTALPVVAILWAFGVSFPGSWGVLAFVGNFIPLVGSLVALVLPVLLAFLELEPPLRPLAVLVLLMLVQFVTNNFIEPRLTAHAVDLSPLVVLVALAFWGLCWGVVGMVLAVPLTVMLKIVGENIALTRPLTRLMAER